LVAVALYFLLDALGLPPAQRSTAAVAGLCAVWWVGQPVPIPVTSLVPLALLPLSGVISHKEVAHAYGHTLVLLLMGGFMLSTAIEASGAHRRLALSMARLVGGKGELSSKRLLLGFMIAAAFASMWISNTAAVLILFPIVLASSEGEDSVTLRKELLLGVAYAASIGGVGTPIGTPPNLLFMAAHEELGLPAWSFSEWMKIGVPIVLLMVPTAYFMLSRRLSDVTVPPIQSPGAMSRREGTVLAVFGLTALAWMTRLEPFGGWSGWFDVGEAGDATVAFAGLVLLLVLPDGKGKRVLSWKEAEKIPWGIVLLFGGGIALASGFKASGLSETLGKQLTVLADAPEVLMILGICLAVTFLTEVTSNTATTALLMPILGSAAVASGIAPAKFMIPAALSASCAFMLPVATAPNAIIFGSGEVTTQFMAKHGIWLNLAGAFWITVVCLLFL